VSYNIFFRLIITRKDKNTVYLLYPYLFTLTQYIYS
jgi:hypothetical protein